MEDTEAHDDALDFELDHHIWLIDHVSLVALIGTWASEVVELRRRRRGDDTPTPWPRRQ